MRVSSILKNNDVYEIQFKKNHCEELKYKILKDNFNRLIFEKKIRINKKLFSKNLNIGLSSPTSTKLPLIMRKKIKTIYGIFMKKAPLII